MITREEMTRRRNLVISNWEQNKDLNLPLTQLAKECNVTSDTYRKYLREIGITPKGRVFTYNCDRSFFNSIDSELEAYWLGFLYADGNVSIVEGRSYIMSISLCKEDEGHIIKLKDALKCDIPHYPKIGTNPHNGEETTQIRLDISSKELCGDLISHGLVPAKSLIKAFPKNVPNNLFRHFVRGYFDGNGYIGLYFKGGKYQIQIGVSSSLYFIESLSTYLKEALNIDVFSLTKNKAKNGQYWATLRKSGGVALDVLNYLYKDSSIYLDRKREKWLMSALNSGKTEKANP